VYVAVLFLPLALATLVWPAVSHWCRRLVETLAALILSKFVIVATLSLAAGAVASGTAGSGDHGSGFSSVLAGGALLVIATFVPFAILRMIPAVEAGAVGHLEGLRQRGTGAMTRVGRTAAQHALGGGLQSLGSARLLAAAADGVAGSAASDEDEWLEAAKADGRWEDDSPRMIAEVLSGHRPAPPPRPRGSKPIIGWKPEDEAGGDGGTDDGSGETGAPADGSRDERPGAVSATARGISRRPPGPTGPEDAWMWEGVPAGEYLIGTPVPGKERWYMGHDEHGPQYRTLPPSWPPGQKPEERA
jgi:hypothetical protein